MPTRTRRTRNRADITREESALARRVAAGDRGAFDELFDRSFARLHGYFRDLPQAEAHAAIWEVLEQLFAALDTVDDVALHAYRIARRSHPGPSGRDPATRALAPGSRRT